MVNEHTNRRGRDSCADPYFALFRYNYNYNTSVTLSPVSRYNSRTHNKEKVTTIYIFLLLYPNLIIKQKNKIK
jgi:hypothetical protein